MIKSATHGLAAWAGSNHSTYNHSKKVGPPRHRALNIMVSDARNSRENMGKRTAINIHVSSHWKWSEGCFLPVPTGMIAYDTLNQDQKEERNKAAGLPKEREEEGYLGDKRPYWNGQATLDLMDELIAHVEDFARETDQLNSAGRLPDFKLLRCVEVIIHEPHASDYAIHYMNAEQTGSYSMPIPAKKPKRE